MHLHFTHDKSTILTVFFALLSSAPFHNFCVHAVEEKAIPSIYNLFSLLVAQQCLINVFFPLVFSHDVCQNQKL